MPVLGVGQQRHLARLRFEGSETAAQDADSREACSHKLGDLKGGEVRGVDKNPGVLLPHSARGAGRGPRTRRRKLLETAINHCKLRPDHHQDPVHDIPHLLSTDD